MPRRGRFIVLDGPDGCGKTTQAGLLAEALAARDLQVTTVRDPGGTDLGEAVRSLLLNPASGDISPEAETLLYMASRAELTARIILPALEAGRVVIADRFYSATVAYQGVGRGLGVEPILELARFACRGLVPDLTLIFDIDPIQALRRRPEPAPDRIEARPLSYHRRVHDGFRRLVEVLPGRVCLIPASDPIEVVHRRVLEEVEGVL